MKRLFLTLLVAALLSSGCSKTSKSGTGEGGDEAGGISDQDLALQDQKRWADNANIPRPSSGGPFSDVHFDYDSAVVTSEYQEMLRNDAEALRADTSLHAEIEGHCDKRGTTEYNMALGERRARAIAALLTSNGVGANQLSIVSYGEEIPLDPAESESAFAKNRRAHFAVYRQGEGGANKY